MEVSYSSFENIEILNTELHLQALDDMKALFNDDIEVKELFGDKLISRVDELRCCTFMI
jgi:hypothetical protein